MWYADSPARRLLLLLVLATPVLAQDEAPLYPGAMYPLDAEARDFTFGDLSLDGHADLVVANDSFTGFVGVLLGTGSGALGASNLFAAADYVADVAVAQLDADGNPDVVFATWQGTLGVNLGDGTGALGPPSTFPIPFWSQELAAGDMDGDGWADAVTLHTDQIAISIGDGAGGFAPSTQYAAHSSAIAMVLGDMTGNGRPDVVVANHDYYSPPEKVNVLLNDGAGGVQPPVAFPAGNNVSSVDVGDMNGDGFPDVVTTYTGGGTVLVLESTGLGLMPPTEYLVETSVFLGRVEAVDLDVDGNADVLVAVPSRQAVALLPGLGGGVLGSADYFSAGYDPVELATADVDGDGWLDVAAGLGLLDVALLLGDGQGSLEGASSHPIAGWGRDILDTDLDGDGATDLVTANGIQSSLTVLLGDGQGAFAATDLASQVPNSVDVADANGDGHADIVAGSSSTPSAAFFANDGLGGFGSGVLITIGYFPDHIALGDMDRDGDVDLVASCTDAQLVFTFLGDGVGGFAQHASLPLDMDPHDVALADVDQDGYPDLGAVATPNSSFPGHAWIVGGDGAGGFATVLSTFSMNSYPGGVALEDADGDGSLDYVHADVGGERVFLSFGDGLGQFSAPVSVPVGDCPQDAHVADVDLDGHPDLVATNEFHCAISVMLGDGSGGFGAPRPHAVGDGPHTVTLGDVDGDGRVDVAAAGDGYIASVLLNRIEHAGLAPYGKGTPGCDGTHGLYASGVPRPGNADFAITSTNAPPDSAGMGVLVDVADVAGTTLFGVLVHVDLAAPFQFPFQIEGGSGGTAHAPLPIPDNPALVGLTRYAQAVWTWQDACVPSPLALSSTRGVAITVQP